MHAPFSACYEMVSHLLLFSVNIATYELLFKATGDRRRSVILTGIGVAAFVALQDRTWLEIWDYTDILVFTIFSYGIITHKSSWYFISLFCVAIFNRESALFIGLWIALGSFNNQKLDIKKLVVAGTIFCLGYAYLSFIRHGHAGGNSFMMPTNIRFLVISFTHPTPSLDFLSFLLFLFIGRYLWEQRQAMGELAVKISILVGFMLMSILVFGYIIETRVFFSLIPILLFAPFVRKNHDAIHNDHTINKIIDIHETATLNKH